MRDTGSPGKFPGNAPFVDGAAGDKTVPHNKRYGFLPEIPLPSPLPPEPVAIADMANMFGVTHRTLHFYEEKSILSSRRAGLMRIYTHHDIHRMAVVNLCREIGIPVAVIQEAMETLEQTSSQQHADRIFHDILAARKRELTSELSSLHRQIQQINDLLSPDESSDGVSGEHSEQDDVELTEQERKCLELMAEGYAPVRLARVLRISSDELQKLEVAIMQKFDANNRFQAVAKAVLLGIIAA
jgi:DNA-binding transcriptional MerR regulator